MQDALPAPRVAFWQGPNTPGKKSLSLSGPSCSAPFHRAPQKNSLCLVPKHPFVRADRRGSINLSYYESQHLGPDCLQWHGDTRQAQKLCQTPCSAGHLWTAASNGGWWGRGGRDKHGGAAHSVTLRSLACCTFSLKGMNQSALVWSNSGHVQGEGKKKLGKGASYILQICCASPLIQNALD